MKKTRSRIFLAVIILALIALNIYILTLSAGGNSAHDNPSDASEYRTPVTELAKRGDILSQLNSGIGADGFAVSQIAPAALELGVCRLDIYCCDSYQFRPLCGKAASWTSSNEDIATVDENGFVRTYHAGEVTITAEDSQGNTDSCTLNVIKVAYITIDDTPTEYTMKLLDILDEYGVKATFFMNADPEEAELYREIYRRGHTFALHGYKHYTRYANGQIFLDNMEKCRQFLMETTGCEYVDNVIRFPTGSRGIPNYGKILDFMHERDYIAFDWSTEFHDYYYHSASGCLKYFKQYLDKNYANRSEDYAVVLFHPREWSVEALPEALDYIIEQGYTFATITRDTAEYNFHQSYCDE